MANFFISRDPQVSAFVENTLRILAHSQLFYSPPIDTYLKSPHLPNVVNFGYISSAFSVLIDKSSSA